MTSPAAPPGLSGRRILFLNWRDRGHPEAGGAERHCHELAQAFSEGGAAVTMFTARYQGARRRGSDTGVEIIRRGGPKAVYLRAAIHLVLNRSRYDAVIDVQNGIPFFSPLFVGRRTAVVGVIHHVHHGQFSMYLGRFATQLGRFLEGPVSRIVYRSTAVIVVSPSTRRDVRSILRYGGSIHLIPNGQQPLESRMARSERPTITVAGRLVPHKRVDRVLRAVAAIRPRWPRILVNICGTGPAQSTLVETARALGVDDSVTFHGYVSDAARNDLLASAWLVVNASAGEGWGLTVLEAASLGVPTLGIDVPGIRDAIVDGSTGWLVEDDEAVFADALGHALSCLADPDVAHRYRTLCRAWADRFTWDRCARMTARVVTSEIDRIASGNRRRPVPTDLATLVEFSTNELEARDKLASTLRRTDDWATHQNVVRLLLEGCDEVEALSSILRLGVEGSVTVRIATPRDLLMGVGDPTP